MVQVSKEWENAIGPMMGPSNTGWLPQRIERPGCHHMVTLYAAMTNGSLSLQEQKRLQEELKEPCEECAKLVQQSKK